MTLGVGLGEPAYWEYGFFGEEVDPKVRAQKLDEGLDILDGLWSGEPFGYQGEHYKLEEMIFDPPTVQQPRIPIWVGGFWPNKPPMRRAARWDGVCPGCLERRLTPEDWVEILEYIHAHRMGEGIFDAVTFGVTPGDDLAQGAELVAGYAEAGVTWWVEDISPYAHGAEWSAPWEPETVAMLKDRIRQGPPKG